jgi:hypothetical protein
MQILWIQPLSFNSRPLEDQKCELCGYHHRVDHVYSVLFNLGLAVTEPGYLSLAGLCSFVFHVSMALCSEDLLYLVTIKSPGCL